jgi:ELWxxDGT repeat protein
MMEACEPRRLMSGPKVSLLQDINPGGIGSSPQGLVAAGRFAYFAATDAAHGQELWRTDGTTAGTRLVKDIEPGPIGSLVQQIVAVGSEVFFSAEDGNGLELWKSDGTDAGTQLVKDINPGAANSGPSHMTAVGSELYFTADDGVHGNELWKTNGTGAGTVIVADINPTSDSLPQQLTNLDGKLIFVADDGAHGPQLWSSDGTGPGTIRLSNFATNVSIANMTAYRHQLFFTAMDASHGNELWQTNGTVGNEHLFKDIKPGTGSSDATDFVIANGTMYFTADDNTALWLTDGRAGHTRRVVGFAGDNALVADLVAYRTGVAFAANDNVHGQQVWISDGTKIGTKRITNLPTTLDESMGLLPSDPHRLTALGNTLYFAAGDGTEKLELWYSNGTLAGTHQIPDALGSVADGVNPQELVALHHRLVFAGEHRTLGTEMFVAQ